MKYNSVVVWHDKDEPKPTPGRELLVILQDDDIIYCGNYAETNEVFVNEENSLVPFDSVRVWCYTPEPPNMIKHGQLNRETL
jgi:hypothetical protein